MSASRPVAGAVHLNPAAAGWACAAAPDDVAAFHRGLTGYDPTPLHDLPHLASEWGVGRVLVKDESSRFGLPAFKALGVSYAIHRLVQERGGRPVGPAGWDELRALLAAQPPLELVTATDGNHGRAVARFARLLDVPAHVFVPDVVSAAAIEAIRDEGARVSVLAEDYDRTVQRAAREAASRPEAELVQDTAWPGYEVVPKWIVDGYSTLLVEVDEQAAAMGAGTADLVVVPMGVGSFAQAVVTHHRSGRGPRAALVGVEPDTAACVQASLVAGEPVTVPTGASVMAGLNCGTPSSLAWPHLRDGLDAAVAVGDAQSLAAAERLRSLGVPAGPCGAATLAAVQVLVDSGTRLLKPDSTVVLLSTEGSRDLTAAEGPTP